MANSGLDSEGRAIAISAGVLAPGGVETHVRNLSLMLRRAGHTVTIYGTACHWEDQSMLQLRQAGVRFLIPPAPLRAAPKLSAVWAAMQWLNRRPSAATSLCAIGAGTSHILLKRLSSPAAVSIYHELIAPPGKDSKAADCLRRLDVAIANSELVAREMAAICSGKCIRVIPFMTAEKALPPPPSRPAVGSKPLQVGYLGRLEARKRPDLLVYEWARLAAHSPLAPAVLHLYGQDQGNGLRRQLESYVLSNRLDDRIKLHGQYTRAQLPGVLSNLDLVVLPSQWEGMPLVLVEALQHGVPIVATAVGGTAELGDGNPGAIVTSVEWSGFAQGLIEMAARLRSGEIDAVQLHNWVEPRYGFETVSKKWQAALLEPRAFFGFPADGLEQSQ